MSARDVPEPWATALVRANLVDPRNGRPSMRALAEAADAHTTTIAAMMYGTRQTQGSLIARVAVALRMEDRVNEIFGWVGRARTETEPFSPHPDSDLLTSDERQAVNELIRLMVAGRKAGSVPADFSRRLREARSQMGDRDTDLAAHDEPTDIEEEQGHDEHP